jgi:hypothetical protein
MLLAVKQAKQCASDKRFWAAVTIVVSLIIVAAAERDIQSRDDDEVRGNKTVWRLASLNALGSIAYFLWGRRVPQQ